MAGKVGSAWIGFVSGFSMKRLWTLSGLSRAGSRDATIRDRNTGGALTVGMDAYLVKLEDHAQAAFEKMDDDRLYLIAHGTTAIPDGVSPNEASEPAVRLLARLELGRRAEKRRTKREIGLAIFVALLSFVLGSLI